MRILKGLNPSVINDFFKLLITWSSMVLWIKTADINWSHKSHTSNWSWALHNFFPPALFTQNAHWNEFWFSCSMICKNDWMSERERDAWCEWDKIKTFFSRNAHFHAEKACLCSTNKNSIIKFIQCKNMLLFMIKSPSSVCDCNVCVNLLPFISRNFNYVIKLANIVNCFCANFIIFRLCMDYECKIAMDKLLCNSFLW